MKYMLEIFGCQMNEHDAEVLAGHLENLGYTETRDENEADTLILITCCVREHAESKVYGRIGELYRLKQERPQIVLGIGGCMTQQDEVARRIRERFPYMDMVFGTHNLEEFPRIFALARDTGEPVLAILHESGTVVEGLPRKRSDALKAWVTIMYGCNNYCSYCIVPYVRGRECSRNIHHIVAEVEDLAGRGYKEVTLLGQNVNSYGKDLSDQLEFADLLIALDRVDGIERIRYMTSHPRDFNDRLISVIAASRKVCRHFHLPVQSGSDRMLTAMNRGYTRQSYLELVAKIRESVPDAVITTDLIVGFPGESQADHGETLALVQKVGFDAAFTFAYSPRSGTPAAELDEQLSAEEKNVRLRELIALVNESSLRQNTKLVGRVLEVLVEGPSKTDATRLTGRTSGNKLVHFAGPQSLAGAL
ncbi:MAG TPA: tRNA (N6-isopentenyl adenosine(37)-C2)-methylthiotransferase MiaB, partial [Bacillota bacterium]|nr:tRNA (N6-isopentenyl adenosine(37)-C2)-methylthiotransferase MiaB [Bacillota bacterium]